MRALLAVGVSLGVHGAVLLGVASSPEPRRELPRVDATPVEVFDAPLQAAEPPSAPPAAPAPPAPPARRRPVAHANVNVEDVAVDAPAGGDDTSPSAAPPPPTTTSASTSTSTPTSASASARDSERAFDVAALHQALAASAQRCYPPAARRYRLTGEATVDFCLDASGGLKSTALAQTSGQELLDGAARDCVIAGALPFPAEAAGACYSVPVRFR